MPTPSPNTKGNTLYLEGNGSCCNRERGGLHACRYSHIAQSVSAIGHPSCNGFTIFNPLFKPFCDSGDICIKIARLSPEQPTWSALKHPLVLPPLALKPFLPIQPLF